MKFILRKLALIQLLLALLIFVMGFFSDVSSSVGDKVSFADGMSNLFNGAIASIVSVVQMVIFGIAIAQIVIGLLGKDKKWGSVLTGIATVILAVSSFSFVIFNVDFSKYSHYIYTTTLVLNGLIVFHILD